jgi:hypothetical protein
VTATEIRAIVAEQMQIIERNGLLSPAELQAVLLAEIAAQLAEINEFAQMLGSAIIDLRKGQR